MFTKEGNGNEAGNTEQGQGVGEPVTAEQIQQSMPALRAFTVIRRGEGFKGDVAARTQVINAHSVEHGDGALFFYEFIIVAGPDGNYRPVQQMRNALAPGTWTDVAEVVLPPAGVLVGGEVTLQ